MAPIMCIGASFLAYQKSQLSQLVFCISCPLCALFLVIIMYLSVPLFKAMQKKTVNINLVFRVGLTGVRVIRAFRQEVL